MVRSSNNSYLLFSKFRNNRSFGWMFKGGLLLCPTKKYLVWKLDLIDEADCKLPENLTTSSILQLLQTK